MAISLRVVVLLMVVVVGVAATLISLIPVRDAGLTAVRETATLLRGEISQRVAGDLLAFFRAPMDVISSLRDQHTTRQLVVTGHLSTTIPAVAIASKRLKLPTFIANPKEEMCYASSDGAAIWYSGPYWNDTQTEQRPAPHNISTGLIGEFVARVNTTTFDWRPYWTGNSSTYRPTIRPWWATASASQSWGPVYVTFGSTTKTTVSPGVPLSNPLTGALEAIAVVEVNNDFIFEYFSTVNIAKTGRAMLLHTTSRRALGGNWNESTVISINDTWSPASRLATVDEIKEPLFASTVSAVGEDGLFNSTLPYRTQFGSSGDVVYVDIVQIADEFGLDLRLLVMIPEKDFLADVNSRVDVVVIAVCCSVVGLLIIAFIITALMLQPLTTLEERIYCAASFQEDEGDQDQSPSVISEVANIQTAFKTMNGELRKVKSYLPQSILAKLENPDEDDDEEDEGEEADPCNESEGLGGDADQSELGKSRLSSRQSNTSRSMSVSNRQSDTVSQRSHSRRGSRAVGAAAHLATARQAKGLFADTAVVLKKVTVVSVNTLQSHKKLRSDWRSLSKIQTQLLEAVQLYSKKFKGVIDNFQGDHVVVTFNAVIGVVSHQSKAAHFALALVRRFQHGFTGGKGNLEHSSKSLDPNASVNSTSGNNNTKAFKMSTEGYETTMMEGGGEQLLHPLTIGIAAGDCLIGNMGTEGFKRFNVIGSAFTNATLLERLAKVFGVSILTNQATAGAIGFDTYLDALGASELPTAAGTSKASVLFNVRGVKTQSNEEWMYDLRAKEESDLGNGLNQAWIKFVAEGATDGTKQIVTEVITKADRVTAGPADEKVSLPICVLSPLQQASLKALAEAVNHTTTTAALGEYLEAQGNRFFKRAHLPLVESVKFL